MSEERWVNDRMAALEPDAAWQPDADTALDRFRKRRRGVVIRWRNGLCVAAAAIVSAIVLGDLAPRACAQPRGCVETQVAMDLAAGVPAKLISPSQFKLQGNPKAPITIEVYSDYQCPDCVRFSQQDMVLLQEQYIKTGKVKFLHRDFPLPQHQFAKLAARYANAAGEIGKYDAATQAIFHARDQWNLDGNVAAALTKALSADEMKFVQHAVESDPHLDDTVTADFTQAQQDKIQHTPTLVIVSAKAGRQVMTYAISFETLKAYLDSLLAQ